MLCGISGWFYNLFRDKKVERLRESVDYLMQAVCEPDEGQRKYILEYYRRVLNEPDKKKRQEHLDSIAIRLQSRLDVEASGSISLTPEKPDKRP